MACDIEEMITNRKGQEGWRLESEGETETLEVTVLWNEAEGVSVNPEGGSHHEQTQAKSTRREREDQAKMERKEDRNVPGEEGEEIKSPKRKVIRVESEETQEEAEEISFVPSASHKGPCFCVTVGAVKKPSFSGSLHR